MGEGNKSPGGFDRGDKEPQAKKAKQGPWKNHVPREIMGL